MIKLTTQIIIFCFFYGFAIAKEKTPKEKYELAYNQLSDMLEGKKPLDYKKAVFIVEDTYLNNTLNYKEFSNYFTTLAQQIKEYIANKGLQKHKTAYHYGIFSYMTEPSYLNNEQTCTYDFEDIMGDQDWTKMFVTKLIKTKKGNCNSLPTFYKIMAEELKIEAFLAEAPNHLYIKHLDENNKWVNLELTNGHPSSDAWMISSLGISAEAIKQGIYMNGLTLKQSVALCLFNLAGAYTKEYGNDFFVLKCTNQVYKHYPTGIHNLMAKYNCLHDIGKKLQQEAQSKGIKTSELMDANYREFKITAQYINKLGYRELPADKYEEWVKSVENEKEKQNIQKK